jgi:hypothetical protein
MHATLGGSSRDPTLVDLRERGHLQSLDQVLVEHSTAQHSGQRRGQAGAVYPEVHWNQATESDAPHRDTSELAGPYHGIGELIQVLRFPRLEP